MRTRGLFFVLSIILVSCVRHPSPPAAVREDNRSIVFPQFFEHPAVEVGAGGGPYELDGAVLRAVMIAANDFLPPRAREKPCWDRQEAHRYRVIRKGDIIYVRIDEDLEFCGLQYVSLDSGAKYAISTDGRILRRIIDGEPEEPHVPEAHDAGDHGSADAPGVSPTSDTSQDIPSSLLPTEQQDGEDGSVSPMPPALPSVSDGGSTGEM